jgi:preprotein translocase subunit SecG
MFVFLTVIYVLVCLFLIFVVLLQPGRGGLGGAFGGGASQQVFGGAGATNILQKMTAVSAAIFILLSVVLAYLSSTDSTSVDRAFEQENADARTSMSTSMTPAMAPTPAGGLVAPATPTPAVVTPEAPAVTPAPAATDTPAPAPSMDEAPATP